MLTAEYVIVGAGISGLSAALTIKSLLPNAQVMVIDVASCVGGLLRSVQHAGMSFDLGTHLPEVTSNAGLNQLIFPSNHNAWQPLDRLRVGNFFHNKMNDASQFINIATHDDHFCTILTELLQTSDHETHANNLQEALIARYGQTLTYQVFAPLLKKMTAQSLESLAPMAHHYYGLARVAIGSRQTALNLKQIPQLDQCLSFTEDAERPRQSQWLYPKQGIGGWIDYLYERCLAQGVTFLMNTTIHQIQHKEIGYGLIAESQSIHAKELIWTLPFYSAFLGGESSYYQSRAIAIYHFYSNRPANTKQHYLYCQQADMHNYRLTFYDNVVPNDQQQPYRVSVEVICDQDTPSAESIQNELVLMGLYSNKDDVILAGVDHLPSGFPVPLMRAQNEQSLIYHKVKQAYPHVMFAGRGNAGLFFTNEVLLDVYYQLSVKVKEKDSK